MKTTIKWMLALVLIASIAFSASAAQYHKPSQLAPGGFGSGNFTFPESLFVLDRIGIGAISPLDSLHIKGNLKLGGSIHSNQGILYDLASKKVSASALPYETGDITSDYAQSAYAAGYYDVTNLIPTNVKSGVLFGRGQTGIVSGTPCTQGSAGAAQLKLGITSDTNCNGALETGTLTPTSGASSSLTAIPADVCGSKAFFGQGATTWTPSTGTRTACQICTTSGLDATAADVKQGVQTDMNCDGALETGTYQISGGGTLPIGWQEVCIWQQGDVVCPSGPFSTKHTRVVCSALSSTGGARVDRRDSRTGMMGVCTSCPSTGKPGQGCQAGDSTCCSIYTATARRAVNIAGTESCTASTTYTYCCASQFPENIQVTGSQPGDYIVYSGYNICGAAESQRCYLYTDCTKVVYNNVGTYYTTQFTIYTTVSGTAKCHRFQSNGVNEYAPCRYCPG